MALTEKEKRADLLMLKDELEGIGLQADVFEKDDIMGELGLLVVYEDESEYGKSQSEKNGEPLMNAISTYLFELEDEEEEALNDGEILNKYALIFTELPGAYDEYEELELYRVLNEFNEKIALGFFYPGKNDAGETKIRFKYSLYSPAGEIFNTYAYCEAIIQTIFYVGLLTDLLKGEE